MGTKQWLEKVHIFGVTKANEAVLQLCWSASGIAFCTTARTVSVEMQADVTADEEAAWIGVFAGGKNSKKIRLRPGRHRYMLYERAQGTPVEIFVIKLTEEQYAKVWIHALEADADIKPARIRDRRLLFIGDSITAGYGVDGRTDSAFTTADEDVTKAYAYRTAEALRAEAQIIAFSGNGVLSRWIEPQQDFARTDQILPGIVPYNALGEPELIVINLGTNDASYTRKIPAREAAFVEAYTAFVKRLQQTFSKACIVLAYGLMEQTLLLRVQETARRCQVDFLPLPLQNPANGMGTGGHPSAKTQQETADLISRFITKRMMWETDETGIYDLVSE